MCAKPEPLFQMVKPQYGEILCNLFDLQFDPHPSLRRHIRSLYIATDAPSLQFSGMMQPIVTLVRRAIVHLPGLRKLTIEIPLYITWCRSVSTTTSHLRN